MRLAVVLSPEQTDFSAATFSGGFEDALERVAALGYDGVELAVRDPAALDATALAAAVARAGMGVPAVGTGQAYLHDGLSLTSPDAAVRAEALRRLESHVTLAERLGAVVIVGLLRGGPDARDHAALVAALAVAAEFADKRGVRIAVEAINRYETALVNDCADGLRLLEAVGADNVGLLLDTFHMNIEERSLEQAIRAAGDRLLHFHVADSNRHHPGDGHIDFGAALAALDATGYDGWVSGEFMPWPDAETAAARAAAHLRSITGGATA